MAASPISKRNNSSKDWIAAWQKTLVHMVRLKAAVFFAEKLADQSN